MAKQKFFIKIVVFALICILIHWLVSDTLKFKGVEAIIPTLEFYALEENSTDVLFIGSSSAFWGISPMYIWRDYGITSAVRASFMLSPVVSELYLKEALEYQDPKLVMINPQSAFSEYNYEAYEGSLSNSLSFEKLSADKLSAVYDIYINSNFKIGLHELLFPVFRYHSRWSELTIYDNDNSKYLNSSRTRGQYIVPTIKELDFQEKMNPTDEIADMDPEAERYYRNMIEYCLEKGIEVALLVLPRQDWNYANHNGLQRLADEYGIENIDLNVIEVRESLALDNSYDYYDSSHLNVFGSEKAAAYLGKFIRERYGIDDRRGDAETAGNWNEAIDWYTETVEKYKNKE